MKWVQVSLDVDAEAAEAVAEVLSRFVPGGVAFETQGDGESITRSPVTVKAYLPVSPETKSVQHRLAEAMWHLGQIYPIPEPTFVKIAEADWADAWKEHFHPLRVGQRIVIKPSWREFEIAPEDILIELDPGMAFGTGLHPTTQMCLTTIEEKMRPGMRVLDLGTGSGILALAAAKLGAGEVLALDTDPVAVATARENIQRNDAAQVVTVAQGSLDRATGVHDLVIVNILAKVIIALAREGLAERVGSEGQWVTAGIIDTQVAEVAAILEAAGLRVTEKRQISDWVTLIGNKV